jgi:hypothetical protein
VLKLDIEEGTFALFGEKSKNVGLTNDLANEDYDETVQTQYTSQVFDAIWKFSKNKHQWKGSFYNKDLCLNVPRFIKKILKKHQK